MLSRIKDTVVSGCRTACGLVSRGQKGLTVLAVMAMMGAAQVASAAQFDGFVSTDETSGEVSLDPTVFSDWLIDNVTTALAAILVIFAVLLGARLVFTIFKRYAK